MKIYLIRHWKDSEGFLGGWSNLGLTAEGIAQTESFAYFLLHNLPKLNKIIASDLFRAKQTAEIINKKLKIDIDYSSGWREINNGSLAGMDNKTAEKIYPALYFNTLKTNEPYPNGESPQMFFDRIKNSFNI